MDRQTFLAACKLAAEYGENISIGGGEPTVHPLFWDFIGLAIAYTDEGPPWLATNGKLTETALILARLARKGVLSVELSQDEFHEEIEWDVVEAFQKPKRGEYMARYNDDFRGIRDITQGGRKEPIPVGRAAELYDAEQTECCCDDLFVAPNGDLYTCGCQSIKIGTVFEPEITDEIMEKSSDYGWCSMNWEEEEE